MSFVGGEQLDFVVTVKAYPAVGMRTGEAVCVAGVTAEGEPRWVRLFPVPFRDLPEAMQFKKWQRVKVQVRRPRNDLRPESWSPVVSTLEVVSELPAGDWAQRRRLIDSLPLRTMCDMNRLNKLVPGRDQSTSSLAVVRARQVPEFFVEPRSQEDIAAAKAKLSQGQLPMFASANEPIEVLEHAFYYRYKCMDPQCTGHRQSTGRWRRPIAGGAATTRATGRFACRGAGSMTSGRATVTPGCSSGTSTSIRTPSLSLACSGLPTRPCRVSSRLDSCETRAARLNCFDDTGAVTGFVVGFEAQDSHETAHSQVR